MTTDMRPDEHGTALPPPPDAPITHEGQVVERRSNPVMLLVIVGLVVWLGVQYGMNWPLIIGGFVVMIFLHELGHYLTAKATGMKVTEFFLGFGPRLWSFRRGETEYGLKAIPAGAYVKIIGMSNLDEVDPADEERSYRQKSYPRRVLVAVAGSGMQFLFAIVLLFVAFAFVGVRDESRWFVGDVVPESAAANAGLLAGDRIVAVDGQPVEEFSDLSPLLIPRAGDTVTLALLRDGVAVDQSVTLTWRLTNAGAAGIDGLLRNDQVLSVDGRAVTTYGDFVAAAPAGGTYRMEVVARDPLTGELEKLIVDAAVASHAADGASGFLGVGPDAPSEKVGPVAAVGRSFETFGDLIVLTVQGAGRFFTPSGVGGFVADAFREEAPDDTPIAGDAGRLERDTRDENRIISIVGAARLGKQATDSDGSTGFLSALVTINIGIALANLVPLLPLDGGHIAVATYERIRSRRGRRYHADFAKLLPVTYVVFALLVSLSLLALYRDVIDPVNING